ncbi:MAG TPA: thiazole synthase, partial [Desulfomicrobium sp.]|nr:thiazole synthase [Desulfomicrobium sp.]
MEHTDIFELGGKRLTSRLFTGTGKYGDDGLIPAVCEASGSQVITVALRRVDLDGRADNVMRHIPGHMTLLPHT